MKHEAIRTAQSALFPGQCVGGKTEVTAGVSAAGFRIRSMINYLHYRITYGMVGMQRQKQTATTNAQSDKISPDEIAAHQRSIVVRRRRCARQRPGGATPRARRGPTEQSQCA
jgi:hypothetical protein